MLNYTIKNINKHLKNTNKTQSVQVSKHWQEFASKGQIKSGAKITFFSAYDYQIELSKLIDKYQSIFIFKTRQLGITETVSCKLLHKACQNKAYNAAILSIGQSESSNIAKRVRSMTATIPTIAF